MFKHKRYPYFLTIFLLIFLLLPSAAFAEGGDGSGGGTGEGLGLNKGVALTLEKSSIPDGDSDVPINPTIQLDFNKNICNVVALSNNKKCFHLTEQDGDAVAIRLIFPDDQVQQDYKRQAFLTPLEDLKPNTTYQVAVDHTLTAKNGTAIDNAHTFTFTTGTRRTEQENKALKRLDENIITYETAYQETADSVPVNKTGLEDVSQEQESDTGSIARIAAVILILVVLIFTILLFVLRRKRE